MLGNAVLTEMFGTKNGERERKMRKIYNEDLHDSYSSLNIVRIF
jgi:hypothetical protein